MNNDHARGLYGKFTIARTDGSSEPGGKHHGCEYFVLDLIHDKHAPSALAAYASSCEEEFPALAADLRAKLPDEWGADDTPTVCRLLRTKNGALLDSNSQLRQVNDGLRLRLEEAKQILRMINRDHTHLSFDEHMDTIVQTNKRAAEFITREDEALRLKDLLVKPDPVEIRAKEIFMAMPDRPVDIVWTDGGNSARQTQARYQARKELRGDGDR